MKAMKLIIVFFIFMFLTYCGVLFVNANKQEVVVKFMGYESQQVAVGLVVLTSVLIGMISCAILCSIELISLYMQRSSLRKKVETMSRVRIESPST